MHRSLLFSLFLLMPHFSCFAQETRRSSYEWLGATLLGAAAGAGAGYLSGHTSHTKVRKIESNPIYITNTCPNTTDELSFQCENLVTDPYLSFQFRIYSPAAMIIFEEIGNWQSPDIIYTLPATTPKQEGTYWIEITIEEPSKNQTPLVELHANGIPYQESPTQEQFWNSGERILVSFSFYS